MIAKNVNEISYKLNPLLPQGEKGLVTYADRCVNPFARRRGPRFFWASRVEMAFGRLGLDRPLDGLP
jgi:hypothetical protein